MDNSILDGMKISQLDISYTPDLASSVQAQIEIWVLRNKLSDMQQKAIYF